MPAPTDPPSASRAISRGGWVRRTLKGAFLFAVFLAAMLGSTAWLDRVLPPLAVPIVDEKLAHFAAHKDEYDTLFFGSSRMYHQIAPPLFDSITRDAGVPTKSFNFGIDGLFPPEDSYVAEKLFALRPTRLKRVFIEVAFFRRNWFGIDPDSTRALHWHDTARLWAVVRETCTEYQPIDMETALNRKPPSPPKKFRWKDWRKHLDRTLKSCVKVRGTIGQAMGILLGHREKHPPIFDLADHVRLYLRRMLNLGRGAQLFAALDGRPAAGPDWKLIGPLKDGACLVPHPAKDPPELRGQFEKLRDERIASPLPVLSASEAHADGLRNIVRLVREAGAEPILVIAPDPHGCRRFIADEPRLPMFDFSQPAEYPQLFQTENRIDRSHLDEPGARIWTGEIARRFIGHERRKNP